MKKWPLLISAFLFMLLSVSQAHAYLYATDFSPFTSATSNFYRINPATGGVTLIGNTGESKLTGITRDSDGSIYSANEASSSYFMRINPATGAASRIERIGTRTHYEGDLAIDPLTGALYYATSTNRSGQWTDSLFTINKADGSATKLFDLDSAMARDISGLQFIQGTLYALSTAFGEDSLLTIDLGTGAVTFIGTTGVNFIRAAGMAHDPATGVTYLAGSWGDDGEDSLYSLNLNTGAATHLTELHGIVHDISGLFSSEVLLPIPVPAAFWLMGSGLLGLALAGRRSR